MVSVSVERPESMEDTTPTLMKKVTTIAISVPKNAASNTLENFMMLEFILQTLIDPQTKLRVKETMNLFGMLFLKEYHLII